MPLTLARLALAPVFFALFAWSPTRADELPLVLKRDTGLLGSQAAGEEGPLFLSADLIQSISPTLIEATGKVEGRKAGQNFFADTVRYDYSEERVEAAGNIRLERPNLILTGTTLKLKLGDNTGEMTDPTYQILPTEGRRIAGHGEGESLQLLGQNRFSAKDATYTTCSPGNEDWQLKVSDLNIDQNEQVGTARNVLLKFKSMPLLYTPWADFPLNDARKSGFLSPTIGFSGNNGLDVILPYYLNLAPNYDATLYPRFLATRGLQLGSEFRYLMPSFEGEAALEYLKDQTANSTRWLAALNHTQNFTPNLKGQLTFQRVSDNEYFRDLSNQIEITSRSILPQDGTLNYDGEWWQAGMRLQQLQVLQDPNKPILQTPYYRLPQLTLTANRPLGGYLEAGVETEYSYFHHPSPDPLTQVGGGSRFTVYPNIKLPYSTSAFFITPKVGYHYTYYSINQPLAGMEDRQTRALPIGSVDSGLIFERNLELGDNRYLQTLEPRAYYVYAPYRNQSTLPVFDTALLDLSFAQIFTENQFIGGDRINDANQLTVAMTSRFIEESNGLERLKIAFGQRFYFSSQQVTLLPTDPPRDSKATDLLALLSGQISKAWRVDTGWQYDTDLGKTIKTTISTSYHPELGKTASVGYRFIDGSVEQLDTAMQWPLTRNVYGLLRANYSFRDNNLVEGLAGLEYNGGCWMLRAVAQRITTAEKNVNNAFFLQLELNGMGRLGASPMNALKHSIPGYTPTNEITPD